MAKARQLATQAAPNRSMAVAPGRADRQSKNNQLHFSAILSIPDRTLEDSLMRGR
jgi:hypothetical protein